MDKASKLFKRFTITLDPIGRKTGQLQVPLEASNEETARVIARDQYTAYRVKKVVECENAFFDDVGITWDPQNPTNMGMRIFAKPGATAENAYKTPLAKEMMVSFTEDMNSVAEADYPGLLDWSKTTGKCYWVVVRKNSDAEIHALVATRREWDVERAVEENSKDAVEVYRGRSRSVVTRIKAQFKKLGKSDLLETGLVVRPR